MMPVASGFPVTYLCGGLRLLILSQKTLGGGRVTQQDEPDSDSKHVTFHPPSLGAS